MKNFIFIFFFLLFAGCNKEKHYIYQVQEQQLYQSSSQKQTQKTTMQFISIAYSHVFGTTITNTQLNQLDIAYQSFGDKHIVEDMIVKNFLNQPTAAVPSNTDMRADISAFVQSTYLRFYNRKPTEFEAWKLKDLIEKNTDITPQMVFYSMMTAEEYRYY
jgi:hypothetical protein